jgi:ABC transport system ATP-binding/permease protein
MSILLNIKDLSLSYGEKIIFNQAELIIRKGDHIGLIGLNGQGKSLLFRILAGEVSPDQSTPPCVIDRSREGFVTFLVPQSLNIKDFSHLTTENYFLAFYPNLHQLHQEQLKELDPTKHQLLLDQFEQAGGWERQNSYISYLKRFGLTGDKLSVQVGELSGGEKRKMALSVGLSSSAELILWDEPTNHLDIETIEQFEDELLQSSNTYMIITHDRYLLNFTTDRICHIERGKLTSFAGRYLDYLDYQEEREAERRKNLEKLTNRHRRELAWMRQGIKARGTRSKKRVEMFHNIGSDIKALKGSAKQVLDLNLLHSGRKTKLLVDIRDGFFSYSEGAPVLSKINLGVKQGDKIALIGENGAGKTTLINLIQQKLQLSSGKYKSAEHLKVVVFDQNRERLDPALTPLELVGEGSDMVNLGDGSQRHVDSYLGKFLFTSDQVRRPIATLSGGERNRLQLAIFMKQAADLWIFDEPTNDLDIETIELLERELIDYQAAVIIIGHDRAFLDRVCQTTWLINQESIECFTGGYTQVAPYLEALRLERQMEQPDLSKSMGREVAAVPAGVVDPPKRRPTNRQRIRWGVIEDEIALAEEGLSEVEQQLASFDFSCMGQAKQSEYEGLNKKKDEATAKVEALYEEWEELTKRFS